MIQSTTALASASTSTPSLTQPVSRQRSCSDRHIRPSPSLTSLHEELSTSGSRQRSASGQNTEQFRTFYNHHSNPQYRHHPTNLLEQQQQHLQLLQPCRTMPVSAMSNEQHQQHQQYQQQQQQQQQQSNGSDQDQLHPLQQTTTRSDLLSLSLPTRKLSGSQFIRMARQASDSAFRSVGLTKKSSDQNLNGSSKKAHQHLIQEGSSLSSQKSSRRKKNRDQGESNGVYEQNPKAYLFQQEQPRHQQQPPPPRPTRPRSHETVPDEWTLNVQGFQSLASLQPCQQEPHLQRTMTLERPRKPFGELRKNSSLPDLKAAAASSCSTSAPNSTPISIPVCDQSQPGASEQHPLRPHGRSPSRQRVQPHHFISTSIPKDVLQATSLMNQFSLTAPPAPITECQEEMDLYINTTFNNDHSLPERARSPTLQKRSPSRANAPKLRGPHSRLESNEETSSLQRQQFLTRHQILSDESLPDYSAARAISNEPHHPNISPINNLHPNDNHDGLYGCSSNICNNSVFVLESAAPIGRSRHSKELPPTPVDTSDPSSPPPPPFANHHRQTSGSPRTVRTRKESLDFVNHITHFPSPITTMTTTTTTAAAAAMMSPKSMLASVALDAPFDLQNGMSSPPPSSSLISASPSPSPLRRKGSACTGIIPQDVFRSMDPIQVQKVVSECAKTSRVYKVMDEDQLADLKKEQDDLQLLIETMNVSMHIEHRIREASISLIRLHESNSNKEAVMAATAQYQSTTKKMDQISQRLHLSWNRLMAVQRTLLQHETAVLNAGLRRLDGENRELSRQVMQTEKARAEEKEEKMKCKKENYRLKVQSILFSAASNQNQQPHCSSSSEASSNVNPKSGLDVASKVQEEMEKIESMEKYVKELNEEILQKDDKLSSFQDQLSSIQTWACNFQSSIDRNNSNNSKLTASTCGDDQEQFQSPKPEDKEEDLSTTLQSRLTLLQSATEGFIRQLELRNQDLLLQTRMMSQEINSSNRTSDKEKHRSGSHSPTARLSDQIRLSRLLQQQNSSGDESPTQRSSWRSSQGSSPGTRGSGDLRKVLRESLLELDRQLQLDESLSSSSSNSSVSASAATSRPSSTSTTGTAFSATEPVELNSSSPSLSRRSSGSSRSRKNSTLLNRPSLAEQVVQEEEEEGSTSEDKEEDSVKTTTDDTVDDLVVQDANKEIQRLLAMVKQLESVVQQAKKTEVTVC